MVSNVSVMINSLKYHQDFVEYAHLTCSGMDVNANITNNAGLDMYGTNKKYAVFQSPLNAKTMLFGMEENANVNQAII